MNQASLLKTRDRVASLRADIEILRLEEAEAKAQLHIWEEQWKRTEALRAENVLLEQEIIDLRPQMAAQRNMIARYPAIFKEMEQRLLTLEEELALIDADKLNQLQMKQSHLVAQKPVWLPKSYSDPVTLSERAMALYALVIYVPTE